MNLDDHNKQLGCFGKIIQEFFDLLVSIVLFLIFYFSVIVVFGFIANNTENTRFLSFFGLAISSISLALFTWALSIQNKLRLSIQESQNVFDNTKSLFRYLFSFEVFFISYWKRKIYTLSGLLISTAAIFTDILLEIGSGDFASYFDSRNWNPDIIIFSILPFFLGILADWLKKRKSELLQPNFAARLLMYLGVLKFYPTILLFLTGLVGGQKAFFAANNFNDILSLEFFLFEWIPDSYQNSDGNKLYSALGQIWFGILYVMIPLLIFWDTRKSWKKYKRIKEYNRLVLS